ncbi:MAG: Gfo/Idh/MocA family oxidoreductase [Rariglobus sp.]
MQPPKLDIIITGFGFMGEMHAQAYAGLPLANVVAIVDALPDVARSKVARLQMSPVPVFTDLESALAAVSADIVDICLPTDRHAAVAVQALRAGKHVFCEKPLALTLEQTREIREAHEDAGTFFQVGHCIRFWPEYQAFEKFVREGSAGRLLSLTLQRRSARPSYSAANWLNDPARSLGAAVDLHIHDTDFVLHLLGTPPAVFSRGTRDEGGWSHIFTHYLYPDVVVQAEGGWNYPGEWGFQMAFQAVFEHGTVEYDSGTTPTLRLVRANSKPEPLPYVPAGGNASGTSGNLSSLGGYVNELAAFLDCVANNRPPALATLDQSAESLRVVLAEVASIESGAPVNLVASSRS